MYLDMTNNKTNLKKRLSNIAFEVTQNAKTEGPFTGKYFNFFEKGTYHCICCDKDLFDSDKKFKSNSGWPSFSDTLDSDSLSYIQDSSYGMIRTEVRCGNCNAHLGHVFDDGPKPSFKRYCINSVAINFKKK